MKRLLLWTLMASQAIMGLYLGVPRGKAIADDLLRHDGSLLRAGLNDGERPKWMAATRTNLLAPTPVNATADRQTPTGESGLGQRTMGRKRCWKPYTWSFLAD